jgi:acetyl-CoA synthetase
MGGPDELFHPDPSVSRTSHCSTMEQYRQLHKRSLEQPERFWAEIAQQFHWEAPVKTNFFSYNFDLGKGPISIKWMEEASTNICYNLLDRNIKNGLGDKVAYYW